VCEGVPVMEINEAALLPELPEDALNPSLPPAAARRPRRSRVVKKGNERWECRGEFEIEGRGAEEFKVGCRASCSPYV
jgi:hypothetical protein